MHTFSERPPTLTLCDLVVGSPMNLRRLVCRTTNDSPFSSSPLPDKYAVRFIPRENGLYLIDVKFNGSHIPGSPFKIRVGETGQAGDPGMVSAYGAGLEGGTTGETGCYRAATGLLPGCYWAPTGLLPGPPPAHNEGPTRVKLVALPFCVIPFVIGTNSVWLEERLRSTLLP